MAENEHLSDISGPALAVQLATHRKMADGMDRWADVFGGSVPLSIRAFRDMPKPPRATDDATQIGRALDRSVDHPGDELN